ncbi:MAG: hypothetical protein GY820_33400 [Gammaproteobacteria bacterium]|nr:hypothetical protein [Gammaproteobacteria bacterium]
MKITIIPDGVHIWFNSASHDDQHGIYIWSRNERPTQQHRYGNLALFWEFSDLADVFVSVDCSALLLTFI